MAPPDVADRGDGRGPGRAERGGRWNGGGKPQRGGGGRFECRNRSLGKESRLRRVLGVGDDDEMSLDDWASTPAYWRTSGPVPYTLTHSSAPSPILPISIRSGMAPITLARAAVARMALQLTVQ